MGTRATLFPARARWRGPAAKSRCPSRFLAGAARLADRECSLPPVWCGPKMTRLWPLNRAINFTLTPGDDDENCLAFNDPNAYAVIWPAKAGGSLNRGETGCT